MIRPKPRLVASQPPEALLAHRLSEAREAWIAVMMAPHRPRLWLAWFAALDRLEGERVRYLRSKQT